MMINFFGKKKIFYVIVIAAIMCTNYKSLKDSTDNNMSLSMTEESKFCNLRWQPTMGRNDVDTSSLFEYKNIVFYISSLKDSRDTPHVIGSTYKDLNKREDLIPVITKTSIEKWFRNSLNNVFNILRLQKSDKKGDILLDIEIIEFSIMDDYTQTGKISLRISAYTKEEMLIWEGLIKGSSDLYLHSIDSDGISECLSNTLIVTFQNLITDQSFIDAVRKAY